MKRGLLFLVIAGIISGASLGLSGLAGAAANYCVGDNVIPGGVTGASGVSTAYANPRVSHIYTYFHITSQDIKGLSAQAVNGTVTKFGNVYVNGKLVATGAMSAGCGYLAGSTRVNDGYMTFYVRPTSVSFATQSLSAMVVMNSGQFKYAILNSCGNPVKATPVKPAAPKPAVTRTTSPPVTSQTQTQSQSVVINNSPPQVQAAQTTQPSPAAAKTLPNTGPGNVLGISGLATAIGTAGHYVWRMRRY